MQKVTAAVQQRERRPRRVFAVAALALLVVLSALAVVYAKHQSRKLFVELHALDKARDTMDIEWGQLQLEQSTVATHGRVESVARTKLNMKIPPLDKVMIVRP